MRRIASLSAPLATLALAVGCASAPAPAPEAAGGSERVEALPSGEQEGACPDPAALAHDPAPPADPGCDDAALTGYDALLVLGPHPDDEVLAFAGLTHAYHALGKPVTVIVATDGDAYCDACRLWKHGTVRGPSCDAADLSNFATPEVDSFAEVRRGESRAAQEALGTPPPHFLGYPDTGLAAAWRNAGEGKPDQPLRRSDFSRCADCETCRGGYGEGPVTELTAATLVDTLRDRISAMPERTLVATTHWLDGHPDHAALGRFVRQINAELPRPRAVAYGVIHAHSRKGEAHPDCWYPGPKALACPCAGSERCALADPGWVAALARHRLRPDWPQVLPDDEDYGAESQLCLPAELWEGEGARKLLAIRSYGSQIGTLARSGAHPSGLSGMMDCNGYLTSFVRRTEAFVLETAPPAAGAAAGR